MDDDENDSKSTGAQNSDEGPGKEYEIYIKNEEMVDKLKLLNYEAGFLSMGGAYKPIQRHYFVKSTNVGEQFFLFTSLAAWLIRKAGKEDFPMPQEFDDPNSTIASIIAELRNKVSII
ncbi:unnamed protein product [Caenorhabditis auriculariae]|uniref:Intraflagellar transport protein 57 homolog n=1 Tax=Caenorhabditis auriculariae TaxID=2777116 RepID=A0A8S1H395_9PELO|nr:unnamed protein product [Caenorhabditis auriculariae]